MSIYTIIHANGSLDSVKGCKLEHDKNTGQSIIYDTESLCGLYSVVAIVPATSFVRLQENEPNDGN